MPIGESRKDVRTTWIGFAVLFIVFGSISLYKARTSWPYFYAVAGFFGFFATFAPMKLLPLYRLWMKFAGGMAWINTRLLLAFVFYLVMTPISIVLRLSCKDILDEKLDRTSESYWRDKERNDRFEDQY